MSEVVLADRYSPENYPIALSNLVKRYERNPDDAIHYKNAGFGEISEDQANAALRFLADIGLLENPKGANYIPLDCVINWNRKMGATKDEARADVRNVLTDYDVYEELEFVLEEGEQDIESLAEQVGGLVGIDEDELTHLKRTIRVLAELGFLVIEDDNVVSLPDSLEQGSKAVAQEDNQAEVRGKSEAIETEEPDTSTSSIESVELESPSSVSVNLEITIHANEMSEGELRGKLDAINEAFANDAE